MVCEKEEAAPGRQGKAISDSRQLVEKSTRDVRSPSRLSFSLSFRTNREKLLFHAFSFYFFNYRNQ
jgi:hypothetical protein